MPTVSTHRATSPSRTPLSLGLDDAFQTFVTSNDVPNQVQAACIRYRAHTLTCQLSFLAAQTAWLEDERRGYLSALSAVRRLPLELLGEIFKLLLPSFLNAADRHAMFNLGRVCSRWRDALLNVPSLWRGLILGPCACSLHGTRRSARRHAGDYGKLVAWFAKAGGAPKGLIYSSADLHCRCTRGGRCVSVDPLVVRLIKEGPQLDHFSLQVSSISCFRAWMAALGFRSDSGPNPLGSLRSFSLDFVDETPQIWDDGNDPAASVFKLLPLVPALGVFLPLRDSAFDEETDASSCLINIPPTVLGPLVSLTIRWDWEGWHLFDVLAQCPALEMFTLDLNRSEPFDEGPPLVPLNLISLRSFRLVKGGLRILEFMRTPALLSLDLELNVRRFETAEASDRLKRFLQASQALGRLRYLRICELVGAPGTVTIVLPPLPSLRHLVLDSGTACGYYFGPPSLDREGVYVNVNLPALRHLELLNLKRSEYALAHEIKYLQRRVRGEPCMLTVSYAIESTVTEADLQCTARSGRFATPLSIQVVPPVDYEEERDLTL